MVTESNSLFLSSNYSSTLDAWPVAFTGKYSLSPRGDLLTMHIRKLKLTSAFLLSAALTMSLSACGPDEANSSGDKSDSSASASKDNGSSGQGGTGGSSGKKKDGSAGTGEKGTFDNSKPVALPLPFGAVTSAVSEGKTLVLTFAADDLEGKEVATEYEKKLQKNGYENPDGTWTRGKQTVDVDNEADSVEVTLTYPGQAPPLPDAPIDKVGSSADDTLKLTFGLDPDSSDSLSMVKSYAGDLTDKGWDVPTDGGTTATKGGSAITFDSTDPKKVALTVDVPASTV
jgi:hypothetical protein